MKKNFSRKYKKSFIFSSLQCIRMNTKNIYFDNKIKKSDFYKNKKAFQIDDIDVNKRLVSKIEPYGTKNVLKYSIGYNGDVIRPLCFKTSTNDWLFQKIL